MAVPRWPKYQVVSVILNGDRCTTTVRAKDSNGDVQTAKSTVTGKPDELISELKKESERIAVQNLGHEM